ncbi:MAG: hypothetical protein IT426_21030 [Pirellulales bacterium]|nr:hypothetical protein [Pirellulales bacterium]
MALKEDGEYYTHFTFTENGKSTVRRMHRLSVQTADGQIYIFEKDKLPAAMTFDSGLSHTDKHLGTLLGLPRESVPTTFKDFIPGARDWVYVIVGIVSVVLLKAVMILIADTY